MDSWAKSTIPQMMGEFHMAKKSPGWERLVPKDLFTFLGQTELHIKQIKYTFINS